MSLKPLKKKISHFLNMRALQNHRSKLGWRDAPRYTKYLKICQASFKGQLPDSDKYKENAEEFNRNGTTAIWDDNLETVANNMYARVTQWEEEGRELWTKPEEGKLYGTHQNYLGDVWKDFPELEQAYRESIGKLLVNVYKSNYKIFYTSMVKSVGVTTEPSGSQQWHNDAGPGSCIIVAMYLHPTDETNGCLQTLPWEESLEIYHKEQASDDVIQAQYAKEHNIDVKDLDKLTIRTLRHKYYDDTIQSKYKDKVRMPFGKAGSAVLFLNNILHRGGHPDIGKERYALIMHCYPAEEPTPFDLYRQIGRKKQSGFPKDPAF